MVKIRENEEMKNQELLPHSDEKTLKVLWGALNVIRNYFPEENKINQMLIDPLNEIQVMWEELQKRTI